MNDIAENWDVIVIGAGIGGLTCAAKLANKGRKVLILERHNKVGGYAHNFKRKAGPDVVYHFDVALHVTGAMDEGGASRRILEDIGVWDRIEVKRLDEMYRASFPDFTISVPPDRALFREKLLELFPDDKDGLNSLFNAIDQFAAEVKESRAAMRPGETPSGDVAERFPLIAKYMVATIHDFVSDYVSNEKIIAVFSQLCFYLGLPPKRASAILYLQMWLGFFDGGAYYIHGGGYALTRAMADVVEENGGKALTRNEVAKILVEDGRCVGVETAKGQTFKAPVIVSNAAAPVTFSNLIDPSVVDSSYLEQVQNMEHSVSIIQAYIGVKGTPEEIGFEDPEYFVNPSYDFEEGFDRMLAGDCSLGVCVMANNTVVNPGDTPTGRSIIEIAILGNGKVWAEYSDEEYKTKKAEVTEMLIDRFTEIIPDIRERIEVIEVGTPRTMERYSGNPYGACFGYALTPTQHSFFRPRPDTPVPGLYLASGWTFPGPGFGGTMVAGMNTAAIILKREKA